MGTDAETARVVVVTGGGRGIGEAIVQRLAVDGFAIAVWDLDGDSAERSARTARSTGARAVAVACDVSRLDSVEAAAKSTRTQLGVPWALINNAGVDRLSLFKDSNPDDWQLIVSVNLVGTLNCTKALIDGMITAGAGRVVCISSDAARVGSTGESVYAASKAGVLGFVKALAREVARHGIAVNAVCPGPTDTALLDAVRQGPRGDRIMEAVIRSVPMGRVAQPEDIAGVISFFLSEDAGYVTGQTLSVSGGLTMV